MDPQTAGFLRAVLLRAVTMAPCWAAAAATLFLLARATLPSPATLEAAIGLLALCTLLGFLLGTLAGAALLRRFHPGTLHPVQRLGAEITAAILLFLAATLLAAAL